MIDLSPNNTSEITKIYAFMSIDAKGNNGIAAGFISAIGWIPLVTSSDSLVEHFKGVAQEITDTSGIRIGLFSFSRDDVADLSTNKDPQPIWETRK